MNESHLISSLKAKRNPTSLMNICSAKNFMKYILGGLLLSLSFASNAQKLPQFKVAYFDNKVYDGYYFVSLFEIPIILDKDFNIVYFHLPIKTASDFKLLPGGKIYYATQSNSYIMDSTFRVVDTYACPKGIVNDNHDGLVLPNGHFLLLGNENVKMDFSKYPELKKRWKTETPLIPAAVIIEQDAKHKVIFEWHAKDHFSIEDSDPFYDDRDDPSEWTHCNGLAIDKDGNILLSSRNLNEITKINRKDGSIMWRLGGKHNQFKFVNFPLPFYGQHDIKVLPNGHYTFFDNGQNLKTHGARALEFELDQTKKIATLKWSFTFDDNVSSNGRGNVQRFEDGNTLVNLGTPSSGETCFMVVNPAGKKLFQVNTSPSKYYRIIHYPTLPFRLHRPEITISDSAGVRYLDAGAGYSSYHWNTGELKRKIALKHPGSYSVFVPYGEGGLLSSKIITITDITKPSIISPISPKKK